MRNGAGWRRVVAVVGVVAGVWFGAAPAHARLPTALDVQAPNLPVNDFELTLSLLGGQYDKAWGHPDKIPAPPVKPVPRARCARGSDPLQGMQGRVTAADMDSPGAEDGWRCNTSVVSHFGTAGGLRTWRYTDANGHTCAFYDSSLQSPAGLLTTLAGPSEGVQVLDMTDPAHPVRTAVLRTPAMIAPHESLNLNAKRGLLAAEATVTTLTSPSLMAIYDVKSDCRRPILLSQLPVDLGHESAFSPDGNTFWVGSAIGYLIAVDVKNPRVPRIIWKGAMYVHGANLSADGRTLYQSEPINGNYGILDVSDIQDRKPDPVVRQISRITWNPVTIPQNAWPLTIKHHRYLFEFDELAFRFNPVTIDDTVGAARLINIDDPRHAFIASNIRLEVNDKANHRLANGDPSPLPSQPLMYSAHYCGTPRRVDPGIVACSFINSGLRVFDVRDPEHPREVAYYIAPPKAARTQLLPGNFAMSQPAFDIARHDVWYTDGVSGFYALHLNNAAWPRRGTAHPRGSVEEHAQY